MAFEAQTAAKQYIFCSYLIVNIDSARNANQLILLREITAFFSVRVIANIYIHSVGKILSCLMLNYMVHRATTMLQRIKGY